MTLDTTANGGISDYEDFDINSVLSSITLPNSTSSVTYNVEIKNLGNVEMGILDITNLPSNLTYSISNYNLKDKLSK